MATLKISDLSVGDWVKASGVAKRVHNIEFQNGEYFVHFSDPDINSEDYLHAPFIKPIPITAEILEKNGWKLSKSNWFEFEDGEWKINIWIGKSKCNIEISQKREIYMSTYADIQVVKSNINTLQHALRFAGVDKEINL